VTGQQPRAEKRSSPTHTNPESAQGIADSAGSRSVGAWGSGFTGLLPTCFGLDISANFSVPLQQLGVGRCLCRCWCGRSVAYCAVRLRGEAVVNRPVENLEAVGCEKPHREGRDPLEADHRAASCWEAECETEIDVDVPNVGVTRHNGELGNRSSLRSGGLRYLYAARSRR